MRWIPVTERLPNESGSYLVTVPMDNGDSYVDALDYHKGKFYECDSEWGDIEYDDVLAWMPLPEPYKADRKTESNSEKPNNCDTCRNKGFEGCEQPCLGCGCCGLYEAMTENDKLKEKVVEFIKSCARCKHRPIGAMMCEESCHYEPKDEPQYSEDDMYWLSLAEDVANGKMSDAGANQAWYEYINHKTEPTAYADGYADGQRDERERWERMADRKTESNSEIPNNSTISKMEQVDGECADCKWHDKEWWYIKCDGCSRLHSHFEPKDESQTDCAWR